MRALVLATAMGLIATSSLAQQDDKFTAKYLLPYCRDAITNKAPIMSSDAVMQGMCVGMVDALDFLMSDLPAEDKEHRSCPPNDATLKQTVRAAAACAAPSCHLHRCRAPVPSLDRSL